MFCLSIYIKFAQAMKKMEIEEYRERIAKKELLKSLKRKAFFKKVLSIKLSASFQKMNYKNWERNQGDYV